MDCRPHAKELLFHSVITLCEKEQYLNLELKVIWSIGNAGSSP